jgi:hypothetical protein
MGTLLAVLDIIVLLLLVFHTTRTVWKEQPQGVGSLLLSIFIALAVVVFSSVSLAAFVGLAGVSSLPMQAILLVILVVIAALLRSSCASKPAA